MRPPFPLYKDTALIPNLLLATDSKSDKVPYTATTWNNSSAKGLQSEMGHSYQINESHLGLDHML